MKVLFISRLYPNEYNIREGAVIHSQALELIKCGVDVRVLSPVPYMPIFAKNIRSNWNEYYSLPYVQEFEGVRVYYPRFIKIPFAINEESMHKFIVMSIKKNIDSIFQEFPFDLVHTHMGYPDNFAGVYVKNKFNVPLVTTIRSSDTDIKVKKNKIKKLLIDSLSNSDKIISPSIQISKKAEEILQTQTIHIGNGIYPQKIIKEVEEIKIESELMRKLKDKKVILSVSNLIQRKGIRYNILAISELITEFPDIMYLIIGDGPERVVLEKLVNDLNLDGNVKFLGDLSHDEAMQYMSICDLFSLPSWRETFGLVYLEAMLLKKPVILCEKEGLDGSVLHNINGVVVPPRSVYSIVHNVRNLLNNIDLKNSIASKGYELVSNNYTWKQIGQNLKYVYRKLL